MILNENVEEMTAEEQLAFTRKLEAFRYALTDKERILFDAILEQPATRLVRESTFDESVWLAAYTD